MEPKRIDVIATTISGSVSDWRKVGAIEREMRKYCRADLSVHIARSHAEARDKAADVAGLGGRIIVSAGGAGTFNSVLEGCCDGGSIPEDTRLVFLRKGSADLIGKAMGIPDDLHVAVQTILRSLREDRYITADVIEIAGETSEKRHFIGFAGIGVFGDTPRYTETRLMKYYKGLLGTLFGDLGPFMVGVNLALLKHHLDTFTGNISRHRIVGDYVSLPMTRYASIIVLNGDMGKDFPLARGMPYGSGRFKVVALKDRGVAASYEQLVNCWKGTIFERPEALGVREFTTSSLDIVPDEGRPYMVNVDGLKMMARGPVRLSVSDRVRLVSGAR